MGAPASHRRLASGGATSVGARTLPKKATSAARNATTNRGFSVKGKIPAREQWHQGYGTIMVMKQEVVPFTQQVTAERIAGDAARATGLKMLVMAINDGWGYYVAP